MVLSIGNIDLNVYKLLVYYFILQSIIWKTRQNYKKLSNQQNYLPKKCNFMNFLTLKIAMELTAFAF